MDRLFVMELSAESGRVGSSVMQAQTQNNVERYFLLSRNEQDTSHKLRVWHGSLAGSLIVVSKQLILGSATFCASAAL